jgi:hypothetical protein
MSALESEISSTTPKPLTTRVLVRNNAKMSRTAEVKERLGPIMERMKSSLAQIQTLEDSLSSKRRSLDTGSQSAVDTESTNSSTFVPGSQKSRQLLKGSMEMLKKKLSRLQQMEDTLALSEDRRQNLQHCFLQSSLAKPVLELASVKRKNQELEQKMTTITNECRRLEEECKDVTSMKQRIEELSNKSQKLSETETKLRQVQLQNKVYEKDLQDRQSKINQLSIRGDDLECEVEELKLACDTLRNRLLDEARRTHSPETGKGTERAHEHFESKDSVGSVSTTTTEIDSYSGISQSSWETDSVNQRSIKEDNLLEVVDLSTLSQLDDDDLSSVLPEGPGVAMIQKLLAKIERMEKENQELRALHETSNEVIEQTYSHRVLERRQKDTLCSVGLGQAAGKVGRGSFFGFLKSDAQPSKRTIAKSKSEKARLISQGLAGQSRGKE